MRIIHPAVEIGIARDTSPPHRVHRAATWQRRSVDVVAKGVGEGQPTTDFGSLFAALQADCKYGPGTVK